MPDSLPALPALAGLVLALGLSLVAPQEPRAQEACGATRMVAVGDTLTNIAARCGVSPQALLAANPQIRDPNVVPLGTTLVIPGGGDAAAETSEGATPETADLGDPPLGIVGVPPLGIVGVPPLGIVGVPPLRVVAIGGALDGRVRLFATQLPPGATVLIGGGSRPGTALFFARGRVDATGALTHETALPPWAARGEALHFVVEAPIGGATLRAAPYSLLVP